MLKTSPEKNGYLILV